MPVTLLWLLFTACTGDKPKAIDLLIYNGTIQSSSTSSRDSIGIDNGRFVDVHAHAGRRGCFFYGNAIENKDERIESALYAKLVTTNSRWFDYDACDWMAGGAHDGSARSAVYAATLQQGQALPLVYTLECNYDSGVAANDLFPRHGVKIGFETGRMSPEPPPTTNISPKYSPESWEDVGKALALAMLDLSGANPCSRLGPADCAALTKLRASVASALQRRERNKRPPRAANELDDSAGEEEDSALSSGMDSGID